MNLMKSLFDKTGLTQTQFAEKVGIRPNHLNRSLHGRGDMKFSTFKRYAETFGIKQLEIKDGNSKITIELS